MKKVTGVRKTLFDIHYDRQQVQAIHWPHRGERIIKIKISPVI